VIAQRATAVAAVDMRWPGESRPTSQRRYGGTLRL